MKREKIMKTNWIVFNLIFDWTKIQLFLMRCYKIKTDIIRYYLLQNSTASKIHYQK